MKPQYQKMAKPQESAASPHPALSSSNHTEDANITVPDELVKGTRMMKVSEKHQKYTTFRINPDEGQILWDSRKNGIVPIEVIKELRMGPDARYYRQQFKFTEEFEDKWITVIYILDAEYKTLHIVAPTKDLFILWSTTLKKLYAIRLGLINGPPSNLELRDAVWDRQYWKCADLDGNQQVSFSEIEKLCHRLNVNASKDMLLKTFQVVDTNKLGYLDFPRFQRFVKLLKGRPDIENLYKKIAETSGGIFNYAAFEKFMRETQLSKLSTEELQALFLRYTASTNTPSAGDPGSAKPPVALVEPVPAPVPTPFAVSSDAATNVPSDATAVNEVSKVDLPAAALSIDPTLRITLESFTSFLGSSFNPASSPLDAHVHQDMTRPISEYYMSSSHNTYLIGHQLIGVSTIEGYIRALLHGCRSVELDIYDGDTEPLIFHGNTLTSSVSVRDVCDAIAKYAFVVSAYPVIISAEVHCGLKGQDQIAAIMTAVFGDRLIRKDGQVLETLHLKALPSPEELKGKVLLKAKNLNVVAKAEAEAAIKQSLTRPPIIQSPSSSSADSSDTSQKIKGELRSLKDKLFKRKSGTPASPGAAKLKPLMSFELAALLVYTVGVKCRGLTKEHSYAPEQIFSLSESTANAILRASDASSEAKVKGSPIDLIRHNLTHVTRIYPKGTRMNSTNFEPQRFWEAGAQLVAINWQTFDLGYMINLSMFARNGRAGYVLKPLALRIPDEASLSKRTKHFFDVSIISAQQLPRPRDSAGREIIDSSIVDPFVQVSIHIPDWASSPYVPPTGPYDYSKEVPLAASKGTTRKVSARTSVVMDNGFNPCWEEDLSLPFDCVGGAAEGGMMELIFVKFEIRHKKDDEDDTPIAVYCTSLASLQSGFRHLPLHDNQMSQFLFSTLFVRVGIRDA